MKPVLEGLLFIVGEDGIDIETICNVDNSNDQF